MLAREEALEAILDVGVVAVVRLDGPDQLVAAAEAIRAGGIRAIEFTMTTPGAIEMLREAARRMGGDTVLGAGTVLDPETARAVILAGAKFIVSPSLNREVIAMARRYSVAVTPGAFTPTEVIAAWEAGADIVKIFPASLGGPELIKALRGPFPHVKMLPTGGVDLKTAGAFMKAGAAAVAVGGNLVDRAAIQRGDGSTTTRTAAEYVAIVREARGLPALVPDGAR